MWWRWRRSWTPAEAGVDTWVASISSQGSAVMVHGEEIGDGWKSGGRGLGEMDIWLQNLVSEKIMRWRKGLWIGGVDEKGTCGDSDIMSCRAC